MSATITAEVFENAGAEIAVDYDYDGSGMFGALALAIVVSAPVWGFVGWMVYALIR